MPFTYVAPRPNQFAGSIADLMLRQGQIAGQGAEQIANIQGQALQSEAGAWAGAAQNIGQDVSGAIKTATDPQRQLASQEVQQRQAAITGQTMVNRLIANLTTTNPDGSRTVDRAKLQAGMSSANPPIPLAVQQATYKTLDDVDKSIATFQQAKIDHMADLAHGVLTAPGGATPGNVHIAAALAKANGLATDDQLAPILAAANTGQDLTPMLSQIRSLSEKYKDLSKPVTLAGAARPGGAPATLVNPLNGEVIAKGADAGPAPPTLASLASAAHPGDPGAAVASMHPPVATSVQHQPVLLDGKPTIVYEDPKVPGRILDLNGQQITNPAGRIKPMPPPSTIINPAQVPSGDALDMAAKRYLATGDLPSMGMGQAGVAARVAVMNRAALIDPSASLSLNKATYGADSANLKKLQTTEGTLSAFENTAGKNLDQFLTLAKKIPDTGMPWLNQPIRTLDKNLVGSANMAAIDAARDVAMREIARVTNDPKLSGALTDSARAEVLGLSPQNATFAQIKAVAQVLKQDMANVHAGVNAQIDTVKSGLANHPGAPPAASGERVRVKGPNGESGTMPKSSTLPPGWSLQ